MIKIVTCRKYTKYLETDNVSIRTLVSGEGINPYDVVGPVHSNNLYYFTSVSTRCKLAYIVLRHSL